MLAPTNDFGYSPAASHQHGGYEHHHAQQAQHHHQLHGMAQHNHSGERPKIFALDSHLPPGMHALVHHGGGGANDYAHIVHGTPQHHHDMTPQHQQQQHHGHHHQGDFDHEPLMMNMHGSAAHYYPPMGAQMLHVSADYPPQPPSVANSTPSTSNSGTKRSREDLNMKEKKRMFKLNDRINQLKDMLDEAGVACKKNKQSILDNTAHYISMLRSNLLIAQQKAERAEKQAEVFRGQAQKQNASGNGSGADIVFKRCFDQSSTARLVTDLALQPLTYNHAFLSHTGLGNQDVHKKDVLRQFLCLDSAKLDRTVQLALESLKATSTIAQARTAHGDATLTLMTSVITDDFGKAVSIEFSLIPFEISSELPSPPPASSSYHSAIPKRESQESSPSGVSDLAV